MEEFVALDNVSTEDILPNVNFQLFMQFTIHEKWQLKAIFQIALILFFGNRNDYD